MAAFGASLQRPTARTRRAAVPEAATLAYSMADAAASAAGRRIWRRKPMPYTR